jgi:hypothetical protein
VFSGAELPYPRLAVDGFVKYPDAHGHVEDYPLPDGTVCDDPPPVLLELCENIMARSAIFPGNVENN